MEILQKIFHDRNDRIIAILAIPLYIAAIGRYGTKIIFALVLSIVIGLIVEIAAFVIRKKRIELLGYPAWILFPLILPPVFPLWMTGVALFFGIVIGVAFFGGHGRTLVSPVAIGWAFAALSFPFAFNLGWSLPFPGFFTGFHHYIASVITTEHPLIYLSYRIPKSLIEILIGNFPQPSGNAIPYMVIICGILLLVLRAIDFRMCLSFLATVWFLTVVLHTFFPNMFQNVSGLFVGNFFFAGFFIIPNQRIAPRTEMGRWLIGILTGLAAFIIRSFSSFPDGVFFAILFGNVFSAIIDESILKQRYQQKLVPPDEAVSSEQEGGES